MDGSRKQNTVGGRKVANIQRREMAVWGVLLGLSDYRGTAALEVRRLKARGRGWWSERLEHSAGTLAAKQSLVSQPRLRQRMAK